jgi:hypothetical protein
MLQTDQADCSQTPSFVRLRSGFGEGIAPARQASVRFQMEPMGTAAKFIFSFLLISSALILSPCFAFAAGGPQDACSLISSADAQAALGEPVGPARAENRSFGSGDGSSCKYRSTSGSALKAKSVSLAVHSSTTDLTGSSSGVAQNLKSAGFKDVQNVGGIGKAAVWGTNSVLGKPQGELTVIVSKSVMLVILIDGISDGSDALSRAKTIATKAIGKL